MIEYLTCTQCGGRREHNLRTGEVGLCDTCFGEMNPPEHIVQSAVEASGGVGTPRMNFIN